MFNPLSITISAGKSKRAMPASRLPPQIIHSPALQKPRRIIDFPNTIISPIRYISCLVVNGDSIREIELRCAFAIPETRHITAGNRTNGTGYTDFPDAILLRIDNINISFLIYCYWSPPESCSIAFHLQTAFICASVKNASAANLTFGCGSHGYQSVCCRLHQCHAEGYLNSAEAFPFTTQNSTGKVDTYPGNFPNAAIAHP
jgi:hypothetical protein